MDNTIDELNKEENARYNRSIYAQYRQYDKTVSSDSNRLESKDIFRMQFSEYSIAEDRIVKKAPNLWDAKNLGGIPVDYDKAQK